MIKRTVTAFAVICLIVAGPMSKGAYAETKEIIVSAAISLKNAFEEIGRSFERKNRDVRVVFNFGPSGGLVRQVVSGAPVDVFASASQKEVLELEKRGMLLPGSKLNFAANTLVLIVPAGSRRGIRAFSDLTAGGAGRIAVGNPRSVPAGRYAAELFERLGLSGRIKDRLVFAENVRQVLDYTARGEVDAGIVYKTDAVLKPTEVRVVSEAPDQAYEPVVYPIAVVKGTKREGAAKAFIAEVASGEGQTILKKYGFKEVR